MLGDSRENVFRPAVVLFDFKNSLGCMAPRAAFGAQILRWLLEREGSRVAGTCRLSCSLPD